MIQPLPQNMSLYANKKDDQKQHLHINYHQGKINGYCAGTNLLSVVLNTYFDRKYQAIQLRVSVICKQRSLIKVGSLAYYVSVKSFHIFAANSKPIFYTLPQKTL